MDKLTRVRAAKLAARRVLRAAEMAPSAQKDSYYLANDLEARIEKAVARALVVGRDQERARAARLARQEAEGTHGDAQWALRAFADALEQAPPGE
jgi:hypothetical protein